MAGVALCEPRHLYNIINQCRRFPRLAEPNYLCLLDARTQREFDESHIVTARRIERSPRGEYLIPSAEELGYVRHCVVYDYNTSVLSCCDYDEEEKETDTQEGAAFLHARNFQEFTRHHVLVLKGGYRHFSSCFPFLGTQKTLWMPQETAHDTVLTCAAQEAKSIHFVLLCEGQHIAELPHRIHMDTEYLPASQFKLFTELDNFQPYPVEILPLKLYMGNFKQACDQKIQKDLRIKALVNVSEQPGTLFAEDGESLHISVPDSLEADLFSFFPIISHFIDAQMDVGAVLVFSSLGISRSSTAIIAYLMHSCRLSLKGAWDYLLKCKPSMRPHRGFVEQLSAWESQMYGTNITDISEPNY